MLAVSLKHLLAWQFPFHLLFWLISAHYSMHWWVTSGFNFRLMSIFLFNLLEWSIYLLCQALRSFSGIVRPCKAAAHLWLLLHNLSSAQKKNPKNKTRVLLCQINVGMALIQIKMMGWTMASMLQLNASPNVIQTVCVAVQLMFG